MRRSSCAVARIGKLFLHRDGVHIRRIQLDGQIDPAFASVPHQRLEQVGAVRLAFFIYDLVEGFNPLRHFGVLFLTDFVNNFRTDGKFQNCRIMHCHIHLEDKSVYRCDSLAEKPELQTGG